MSFGGAQGGGNVAATTLHSRAEFIPTAGQEAFPLPETATEVITVWLNGLEATSEFVIGQAAVSWNGLFPLTIQDTVVVSFD